ncbi:MAG: RNA methyltransferase [Chitinophagales bacterium]|nr:RNA methyltransferase [Chitinophagales bacterium]MCZ2392247.1 RNA methyltransferase [Chitinophagales bacterium]
MLTKSDIKKINALKIKKYRVIENQFIAEGQKIILDLMHAGLKINLLVCLKTLLPAFEGIHLQNIKIAKEEELDKISSLKQSPGCLAIFDIPKFQKESTHSGWVLATDNIQDPGNLGTLIRIADWFGIEKILCSEDTVDAYNPKVVQATMGSIARVQIHYHSLKSWFENHPQTKVYAGLLNGEDIRTIEFKEPGVILIGNEAKGISNELLPYVTQAVWIPKLGQAESLNASVAAGIMVSFALLLR